MEALAPLTGYLSPIAILISASAAIFVAVVGWYVNRKLARESAALSLILQRTREVRTDNRAVTLLLLKNVNIAELADHSPVGASRSTWKTALPEDNLPTKQRQHLYILHLLSFYEAIAIAISKKIIDEATIKRFLNQRLCWQVEELYPFISAARGKKEVGEEETWIELEKLARRWGANLPEPPRRHKN